MYKRNEEILDPAVFVEAMGKAGFKCGPDPQAVSLVLANGKYILKWSDKVQDVEQGRQGQDSVGDIDQRDDAPSGDDGISPTVEEGLRTTD